MESLDQPRPSSNSRTNEEITQENKQLVEEMRRHILADNLGPVEESGDRPTIESEKPVEELSLDRAQNESNGQTVVRITRKQRREMREAEEAALGKAKPKESERFLPLPPDEEEFEMKIPKFRPEGEDLTAQPTMSPRVRKIPRDITPEEPKPDRESEPDHPVVEPEEDSASDPEPATPERKRAESVDAVSLTKTKQENRLKAFFRKKKEARAASAPVESAEAADISATSPDENEPQLIRKRTDLHSGYFASNDGQRVTVSDEIRTPDAGRYFNQNRSESGKQEETPESSARRVRRPNSVLREESKDAKLISEQQRTSVLREESKELKPIQPEQPAPSVLREESKNTEPAPEQPAPSVLREESKEAKPAQPEQPTTSVIREESKNAEPVPEQPAPSAIREESKESEPTQLERPNPSVLREGPRENKLAPERPRASVLRKYNYGRTNTKPEKYNKYADSTINAWISDYDSAE